MSDSLLVELVSEVHRVGDKVNSLQMTLSMLSFWFVLFLFFKTCSPSSLHISNFGELASKIGKAIKG